MPRHFPEYEIEFTDKPSGQDLKILDNGINNHLESIFGKVQRGGLLFLAKVDGRKLVFDVVVRDGETLVAEARVERLLLDRQKFIARALGPSE